MVQAEARQAVRALRTDVVQVRDRHPAFLALADRLCFVDVRQDVVEVFGLISVRLVRGPRGLASGLPLPLLGVLLGLRNNFAYK